MAKTSVAVREMTFAQASAELVKADGILIAAAKSGDKNAIRKAALGFAVAERNARGAKAREATNDIGFGLLK